MAALSFLRRVRASLRGCKTCARSLYYTRPAHISLLTSPLPGTWHRSHCHGSQTPHKCFLRRVNRQEAPPWASQGFSAPKAPAPRSTICAEATVLVQSISEPASREHQKQHCAPKSAMHQRVAELRAAGSGQADSGLTTASLRTDECGGVDYSQPETTSRTQKSWDRIF